jgi:predicted Fe-S protein YdhL (DUF1289 family)
MRSMDGPANAPPRAIASPCVQVCTMDDASGLCLGCFRDLSEIARWTTLSDAERAALIAALPGRRARISAEKLGPGAAEGAVAE